MSLSKIEVKIGSFTFSGEGEGAWLAAQLDKLLDRAEHIIKIFPAVPVEAEAVAAPHHAAADFSASASIAAKSLASFLKEKNATSNQVSKFLVTAAWLEAKGNKRLTTANITAALKAANQGRLGNPSDALNKNTGKGHCEKDGNQFFVTQEGKDSLGIA